MNTHIVGIALYHMRDMAGKASMLCFHLFYLETNNQIIKTDKLLRQ